ncbi:SDR family oxidoreductase [Lactobacillus sp. AN1001]
MKKLVVITGASSGFGKEMARQFSADGYPLLLLARRLERLEELNLPNTISKKVDVTDKDAIEVAVKEAEAQYGPTDLLINSAGVMLLGNIETQDPKEWQTMLDTNVMGTLNAMQVVTDGMKERKHGTIVNFSSLAGVKPFINHAVYCASKFGIQGLSETAREELAPYNVRVMRILPGAVNTELLSHTTNDEIKKDYRAGLKEEGVVGGITPKEIAASVKFAYELPQSVNMREIQIADTHQGA